MYNTLHKHPRSSRQIILGDIMFLVVHTTENCFCTMETILYSVCLYELFLTTIGLCELCFEVDPGVFFGEY